MTVMKPLTLDAIIQVAKEIILRDTIDRVAEHYGLQPEAITAKGRKQIVTDARAVCCYLLRQRGFKLCDIATALHCSHSMVLHNVRRAQDWIDDQRINPQANYVITAISK